MKQKEFFGYGTIKRLNKILKKEKAKRIFLVTGKKSFELCGASERITSLLKKYEKVEKFSDFSSNPKLKEIKKGLDKFKENNFDIIIAIGGGSVIDTAKAIKLFYFEERKIRIPLIAIPTTAGSGSEATYFIVYYKEKQKISGGKKGISQPEYSICDPSLIISLPKKIKAASAMDALCQAIESYWSIKSNKQSKKISERAIKILKKNIVLAVINNNKKYNKKLMLGANLAGKAINITKTTACHALSYPLTSYYNIPHGHAVSLTLAELIEFNSKIKKTDCNDKRGEKYVKKVINEIILLLGASAIEEAKDKVNELMKEIGLETKLSELNVNKDELVKIIDKNLNPERMLNNPRLLSKKDLKEIIEKIY